MFCPLRKEPCSKDCMMYNVGAGLCNLKGSLDFYLSISDAVISATSVQSIDNSIVDNPVCFLFGQGCQKGNCMFWDVYNKACLMLSAALNYQSYSLWLIDQAQQAEAMGARIAEQKEDTKEPSPEPPIKPEGETKGESKENGDIGTKEPTVTE